jgi:hypothetical protein
VQPAALTPPYERAALALADLLGRLRIDFIFVGSVARSVYLGAQVASGSLEVVALLAPEQKNQVAMMAKNRGFSVDRDEVAASEELDLVPLGMDGIRLFVLVASNALYGRMVADGVAGTLSELAIRVPRIEDFALLLQMSSDEAGLLALADGPDFDRPRYNRKLVSIGLRDLVIPE